MAKSRIIVLCTSIALIVGVIAAGGMYFVLNRAQQTKNADYDSQIDSLQTNLTAARQQTAKPATTTPDTTPPPVIYTGDGASTVTAAEKADFTTKLTNPYIDFYAQDSQIPLVSIIITAPTKKGDPYKILGVHQTGNPDTFNYSKKGTALDTWKPTCGTTPCTFSDDYKTKYPDVVK